MTQEAQKVALLKHLGWTSRKVPSDEDVIKQGYDEFRHTWWYNPEGKPATPPDLLNDLNVIHRLEETLTDEQFFDWSKDKHTDMSYNGHLFRIVDRDTPADRPCRYHSATVAQRLEAMVKTLGLWEEES